MGISYLRHGLTTMPVAHDATVRRPDMAFPDYPEANVFAKMRDTFPTTTIQGSVPPEAMEHPPIITEKMADNYRRLVREWSPAEAHHPTPGNDPTAFPGLDSNDQIVITARHTLMTALTSPDPDLRIETAKWVLEHLA